MTDFGWQTVTGDGQVELNPGGTVEPNYMFYRVTGFTNPRVRKLAGPFPARLQYAGICGFMNQDDGPVNPAEYEIVIQLALNWESGIWVDPLFVPATYIVVQFFFWRLPAGVSLAYDLITY